MNINVIGAGTWGITVSTYLSNKGHNVIVYHRNSQQSIDLIKSHEHPKLLGYKIPKSIQFTSIFSSYKNLNS